MKKSKKNKHPFNLTFTTKEMAKEFIKDVKAVEHLLPKDKNECCR